MQELLLLELFPGPLSCCFKSLVFYLLSLRPARTLSFRNMHSLILPLFFVAAVWAETTYDYIIVGGGTTGLVVANRLTEDSKSKFISYIVWG